MLRHIVAFKYKPQVTETHLQQIQDGFKDLKNKIPGITSFECGRNNSPEGLDQGFTHVYLVNFEDAAARDVYLPHPEHQKFVSWLQSLEVLESIFVVDYIPEDIAV